MWRKIAFLALALAFAPAASAQSFNAQEQAEIRAMVRDYLVRNPDVIREALDALQERANNERWQRVKSDPRDFSIGPANAPVTIVEFFDYRCGYCHAALEWVVNLQRSRRDIRIIFKELPILSPQSMEAAQASVAAMPQGRYFQFHQALMSHTGELTSERIDQLARQSGIDVPRMRRAMQNPAITTLLEENHALATDMGAAATPLFIINGEAISGFDREQLEARIQEAAREARSRRQASN